jgi:hypothetical protein
LYPTVLTISGQHRSFSSVPFGSKRSTAAIVGLNVLHPNIIPNLPGFTPHSQAVPITVRHARNFFNMSL